MRTRRPPRRTGAVGPATAAGQSAGLLVPPAAYPYDLAVTLELLGQPGRVVQGAATVGPEAAFVATAIGYGVEERREQPVPVGEFGLPGGPLAPRDVLLSHLPARLLVDGFRLDPRLAPLALDLPPGASLSPPETLRFAARPLPSAWWADALPWCRPAAEPSFLVSVVDSATGRELQDEPIHSLAGLGAADGRRPFRRLAWPMAFMPRSTIRFQVIERTRDLQGRLDLVLFGFRVPTRAGLTEDALRGMVAAELQHRLPTGAPVVPFDYVAQLRLEGTPGTRQTAELTVNADGPFVATAVSYALAPAEPAVALAATGATVDLQGTRLTDIPVDALLDGVRIRPEYVRFAIQAGGGLATAVPRAVAGFLFERLNTPAACRFRYRFVDVGAGREYQNQWVLSTAGLGRGDGQRPFKTLSRPLTLEPRGAIRVEVEESAGRGPLYIVFQGYRPVSGR